MNNNGKYSNNLDWIKVTPEFKRVIDQIVHTKNNFFITGKAGTGKSTLLKYLYNTTRKKCILLAPTGRAALNVGGQTIHSFFSLGWGVLQPSNFDKFYNSDALSVETIIIDEVSMVRADILDTIDHILKNTMKNNLPFGGKQIVLFGDPYQLPPVVPSSKEVSHFFTDYYTSPYFFDAKVYNSAKVKCIELNHVFRQTDSDFIEILNRVRDGSYTQQDLLFINKYVRKHNSTDEKIVLTPYKSVVANINNVALNAINSKPYNFHASITGQINSDNIPAQKVLVLKKGAKVMFVKNNRPLWVNGTLGEVVRFSNNKIMIKKGKMIFEVERATWEEYKYKYDKEKGLLSKIVIGSFTQYPLMLASAITVHKGQGATIDGVHINLDRGAFSFGQTYVALSRTKKLSDMSLEREIRHSDIKIDQRVVNYYQSLEFEGGK